MSALALIDTWPCENVSAVILHGSEVSDTYGDTARRYALASVTKLLTAVTVLIGYEEGSVCLDDPSFPDGATLADLLAHAAGIAPDGTRLDLPGKRRVYSNAGYDLAAGHLEAATDMSFVEYMTEGLLSPAGMTKTSLDGSPAFAATSSADDLARFVTTLPTLLAAETRQRMVTPHLPELIGVLPGYGRQAPNSWGLGPEIRAAKQPHWTAQGNSEHTWGHFGQAGTFLWVDPDADLTAIVLTDHTFGEWALPLWPALSAALLDEAS